MDHRYDVLGVTRDLHNVIKAQSLDWLFPRPSLATTIKINQPTKQYCDICKHVLCILTPTQRQGSLLQCLESDTIQPVTMGTDI